MKPVEIAFFTLAFLLPLVGGGALLYFLSKRGAPGEPAARDEKRDDEPHDPPTKE